MMDLKEIDLVVHHQQRKVVIGSAHGGRGNGGTVQVDRPVKLAYPMSFDKIVITHRYVGIHPFLNSYWYDGGEEAERVFQVFCDHPRLRDGVDGADDLARLLRFMSIFGLDSAHRALLLDSDGRHVVLDIAPKGYSFETFTQDLVVINHRVTPAVEYLEKYHKAETETVNSKIATLMAIPNSPEET